MPATDDNLTIEYVPIGQLKPFDGNPRKISDKGLEKLQRSVEEFGFVNPILAQRGTNMIIAGHQRLKAAKAAGLTEVPVVWLDMDDATAKAYNIADNRLQDEAEWDDELLASLLEELEAEDFDLSLTGLGPDELAGPPEFEGFDGPGDGGGSQLSRGDKVRLVLGKIICDIEDPDHSIYARTAQADPAIVKARVVDLINRGEIL